MCGREMRRVIYIYPASFFICFFERLLPVRRSRVDIIRCATNFFFFYPAAQHTNNFFFWWFSFFFGACVLYLLHW